MNAAKKTFEFTQSARSGEGVLEVQPHDLKAHVRDVHLVDVRRPDEFVGELGHIAGSSLQTLETELGEYLNQVPTEKRDETIVFVCRSGVRSARATAYAEQLGFKRVYNLTGGMIFWNELGFETIKDA